LRPYRQQLSENPAGQSSAWKASGTRSSGSAPAARQRPEEVRRYPRRVFFYTKTNRAVWNQLYTEYTEKYVEEYYRFTDESGRRFQLDNITAPMQVLQKVKSMNGGV
jgi:hypothetical protein